MNNYEVLLPDRPIAFNRDFVRLGIGVKGALFLSQAMYWSKRTKDEDGWFYKTVEEWQEETGLTKEEQLTVKKNLKEKGFLSIEVRGIPPTNYFRVEKAELIVALLSTPSAYMSGKPTLSRGKSRHSSISESTTESTLPVDKSTRVLPSEEEEVTELDYVIDENIDDEGNPKTNGFGRFKSGESIHQKLPSKLNPEARKIEMWFAREVTKTLKPKFPIQARGYKRIKELLEKGMSVHDIVEILTEHLMNTSLSDKDAANIFMALSPKSINDRNLE
jgi:hypothetical protein